MRDGFFLVEGSENASSNFRKCLSQTIFSLEKNAGESRESRSLSRIWGAFSLSESPRMISSDGLSSGGSPQSARIISFARSLTA